MYTCVRMYGACMHVYVRLVAWELCDAGTLPGDRDDDDDDDERERELCVFHSTLTSSPATPSSLPSPLFPPFSSTIPTPPSSPHLH